MTAAQAVPTLEDYDFLYVGLTPDQTAAVLGRAAATRPVDDKTDLLAQDADLETDRYRTEGRRRELRDLRLTPNVFVALLGMVRFGTDRSPDLYYALGDALAAQNDKSLALRAYQRALDSGHPRPDAVRHAMDEVRQSVQLKTSLDPALIAAERTAAGRWVADYQQFEDGLIRAGKDTDDEANYAPFYATHARTLVTPDLFWRDRWDRDGETALVIAGVVAAVGLAIALEVWRAARRRRAAASVQTGRRLR